MSDVRLIHGDCLDVLKTLDAGSVDAVVTDPPYGIVNRFGRLLDRRGGTRRLEFEWDKKDGVAGGVAGGVAASVGLCKRSAALFVFTSIDIVGDLLPVMREAGFVVKPAAWVKKCPPPAGKGNWWPSGFELAFYGYRASPFFGDTDTKRSNVFVSDSLRHGQPGKCGHPTQKPLGLMKRIVESICPPGGVVLDPFMGSGTTGVACVQTGRRFVGIEIDEGYFKIAQKRIAEAQNPHPLFPGTKESGLPCPQ